MICQNLVLLLISLNRTRLTTSGTSMPVSSISTEMATWGALSLVEKSSIRLWAYSVLKVMTRAKCPASFG